MKLNLKAFAIPIVLFAIASIFMASEIAKIKYSTETGTGTWIIFSVAIVAALAVGFLSGPELKNAVINALIGGLIGSVVGGIILAIAINAEASILGPFAGAATSIIVVAMFANFLIIGLIGSLIGGAVGGFIRSTMKDVPIKLNF